MSILKCKLLQLVAMLVFAKLMNFVQLFNLLQFSVVIFRIEEHAMPFAASLQSALRAELDVESRIGATFGGKAYCGIVGGFERHEYSVLGPSVNLAARLMGNPQNQGFLVDEAVRQEAESWEFKPLALVVAKGYAEPVPIFEPLVHNRSPWKRANGIIVGREEELEVIGNFAGEFIDSGCTESKIVLISAATGFGKSSLMAESVSRIRQKCIAASHSHLILGQVCCEEDLFHPLSVFGPIFLDSLSRMKNRLVTPKKDDYDSDGSKKRSVEASSRINETAMAKEQFYAACECAEIPKEHIKTIYSLVFHHEWPSNSDSESDTDNDSQNQHYPCWSDVPSLLLSEEIPKSIVSMFLQATVDFDIVILGVDDLSLMDEVSWKVLQLLFEHACNVMIIGTARPTTCKAISIDPRFWNYLFAEAVYIGRFMHIDLLPLRESDVRRLIIHYLEESEEEAGSSRDEKKPCSEIVGEQFSHENYLQSGGNPRLVAGMIKNYESIALEGNQSLCANADAEIYEKVKEKSSKRISAVDINISEHVLHRLDSLPAIVRTHLNVGALVGFCFSAKDVISVMEEYRGVPDDGKQEHAEFVNDSLSEAVWHGILEVDEELVTTGKEDDLIQNSKYRFAHKLWQEHIIDLTLDDWQKDMQQLISSTRAT